ncbi:MAG: class I SAM-dependent RNA methyltransferase, partial [Nocardioides sp.]|uniref:class I SAM-dependent RNA methyltransferase n=1 Tax=Nocardioides sp. TaxID=35761 RepID=UPI003F07F4A3
AVTGDLPEQEQGLRWRTRVQWAYTEDGRRGLRAHRSRKVVPVDDCLIAHPDARAPEAGAVLTHEVTAGETTHPFTVAGDGFWQVHPGAAPTLVSTVLEVLRPQAGERVLDLYAGVGLFARFLADAVGDGTRVVAVEADRAACGFAKTNLGSHQGAVVATGAVEQVLREQFDEPFDLVVLDPPREGAKRAVVEQVVDRAPRAVAYVACDPAALARDVAIFAEHGYTLSELKAFDLFPMTHHVECVALLERR